MAAAKGLIHYGIAGLCTDRCPVADLGGYRQATLVDGDLEFAAGRECYFDEFGILRYFLRHDDGGGLGGSGGEIVRSYARGDGNRSRVVTGR